MKINMRRRDFLNTLAKSSMLLPFTQQLMFGSKAIGATNPRRVVFVVYPNGITFDRGVWLPNSANISSNGTALSKELSPLANYNDKIILFDGVHGEKDGHQKGSDEVLRGYGNEHNRGNDTIERVIANGIGQSAYTVGVGTNGKSTEWFSTPSQENVNTARNDLLSNAQPRSGNSAGGDTDNAEQEALQERLDILETIRTDLSNLKSKHFSAISKAEQDKITEHERAFDQLKGQLDAQLGDGGNDIAPPSISGECRRLDGFNGSQDNYDAVADAHIDTITMALACDARRVMGLQLFFHTPEVNLVGSDIENWAKQTYNINGSLNLDYGDRNLHSASHKAGGGGANGGSADYAANSAHHYWYNLRVKRLVDNLSSTIDGNGKPLIDSTMVVMLSPIGHGPHQQSDNSGTYIIGGTDYLNTGRVYNGSNGGLDNVLRTVATAMQVPDAKFGNQFRGATFSDLIKS